MFIVNGNNPLESIYKSKLGYGYEFTIEERKNSSLRKKVNIVIYLTPIEGLKKYRHFPPKGFNIEYFLCQERKKQEN